MRLKRVWPTYVRFVCFRIVAGKRRTRLGIFQAIQFAEDNDASPSWSLNEIRDLSEWFRHNLPAPPMAGRNHAPDQNSPISWYKSAAKDHIHRSYQLKDALKACGVHIDVITTSSPGFITYEDEYQIFATPHGHTQT